MEREEVHQAAYAAHDASRARVSNIYANTRRVAGLMTAFEDDDYKLQVWKHVALRWGVMCQRMHTC